MGKGRKTGAKQLGKDKVEQIVETDRDKREREFFLSAYSKYVKEIFQQKFLKRKREKGKDQSSSFFSPD
jgi:hypothetical protein